MLEKLPFVFTAQQNVRIALEKFFTEKKHEPNNLKVTINIEEKKLILGKHNMIKLINL